MKSPLIYERMLPLLSERVNMPTKMRDKTLKELNTNKINILSQDLPSVLFQSEALHGIMVDENNIVYHTTNSDKVIPLGETDLITRKVDMTLYYYDANTRGLFDDENFFDDMDNGSIVLTPLQQKLHDEYEDDVDLLILFESYFEIRHINYKDEDGTPEFNTSKANFREHRITFNLTEDIDKEMLEVITYTYTGSRLNKLVDNALYILATDEHSKGFNDRGIQDILSQNLTKVLTGIDEQLTTGLTDDNLFPDDLEL